MAIYKAISNGNADTLAIWETWDGSAWVAASVLPSIDDDVYTNGYIVTITTSQSYNSWNRSSVEAPYNITQGGQFQIDGTNEITLTGQVNGSNVTQTVNNPLSACVNRLPTHTNTLHRVGDNVGGSSSFCYAFWNGSTYDIDLVGNQQGGNGNNSYGFYNYAAATFTSIVGNQQGGGNNSHGFLNNAAATFTSIVGNQQGGNNSHGFYNYAAATFTSIVGNQQGGNNSYGFYNNAAGSIITFDNSFQKTGVNQAVCNVGDNTTINFINCRAYANSIYNSKSTTTINFQGITYNDLQNGTMAIKSLGTVNFDLSVFYIGLTPTYTDIALYPAGTLENPPAITDVRSGVVYGIGNNYTGTLVVPIEGHVVQGVEYDIDKIGQLPVAQTVEDVDIELIKTKLQAIQEETTNAPENVVLQLKQDTLGQRLNKVATLEELVNILTSLLNG